MRSFLLHLRLLLQLLPGCPELIVGSWMGLWMETLMGLLTEVVVSLAGVLVRTKLPFHRYIPQGCTIYRKPILEVNVLNYLINTFGASIAKHAIVFIVQYKVFTFRYCKFCFNDSIRT